MVGEVSETLLWCLFEVEGDVLRLVLEDERSLGFHYELFLLGSLFFGLRSRSWWELQTVTRRFLLYSCKCD